MVLEGLIAETNVYSTSLDLIKPTKKLLSIYSFNCKELHLINVFR